MKGNLSKLLLLFFLLLIVSCSTKPLKKSKSLKNFLKAEKIEYIVDNEGDFRVLSNGDTIRKDVWIRGQLNHSATVAIREIFSVSLTVNEEELVSLSRVLLLDNLQTRIMGSWSIMPKENMNSRNYLVLYTVKAGIDSEKDYILQAVREVSDAASTLEKVLSP